eukprot:TRINITY_DN29743_c0_g1_i1.p1 TRINITY_DN29743_c0_g1~~TRINITY_DN29743_c0_g1_i1.p1  ORF type:complete len:563 (+),score=97.66 TRINITY_DN29743_c0_g1_i1:72-1760(+)
MAWDSWTSRRLVGLCVFLASYASLAIGLWGDLVYYEDFQSVDAGWQQDVPVGDVMKKAGVPDNPETDELEKEASVWDADVEVGAVPLVPPTTRSLMRNQGGHSGLIPLLWNRARHGDSSYLAPVILVFFGVVLPAMKFLAVLYWIFMPLPGGKAAVNFAARMTRWTAVDAVAEAMIVALLLRANVHAEHRAGYVAFVCYVIFSALAIWLMDTAGVTRGHHPMAHQILDCFGDLRGSRVPLITFCLYAFMLFVGACCLPLARLYVPEASVKWTLNNAVGDHRKDIAKVLHSNMHESYNHFLQGVLNGVHLPQGAASVRGAFATLLLSGHPYTVAGSVLLLVGVLACPLAEAWLSYVLADKAAKQRVFLSDSDLHGPARTVTSTAEDGNNVYPLLPTEAHAGPKEAAELASLDKTQFLLDSVGDLAMLDVFVTGIAVASLVLGTLGDVLTAELLSGFYVLLMASACGIIHAGVCGSIVLAFDDRRQRAQHLHKQIVEAHNSAVEAETRRKASDWGLSNLLGFGGARETKAGYSQGNAISAGDSGDWARVQHLHTELTKLSSGPP